jgi:REP element-mobilizing transposase RayT
LGDGGRQPMVTEAIEADVYRCIEDQVKRHFRSEVLAIGGMPDHVHVLVRIRTTVAVSKLVQQMKGVSTNFVRDQLQTGARSTGRMATACSA